MSDQDLELLQETDIALPAIDSEISTQIATARRFPRALVNCRRKAMEMATLDEETAASCFYSLPRAGKQINGPSARLAEIVATSWGNVRFGARVDGHDGAEITAKGMCHDLENNVAVQIEVRRRITDRNGKTYDNDMIAVTGNAANSIAMRNAVLKVVPGTFWKPVYEAARRAAIGDAVTLVQRRQAAIDYFAKLHVSVDQILAVLRKQKVEEIGLDDLETLTGLKTAIKEGDTTIEQAFPVDAKPAGPTKAPRKSEKTKEAAAPPPPKPSQEPEPTGDTQNNPAQSSQAAPASAAGGDGDSGSAAPVETTAPVTQAPLEPLIGGSGKVSPGTLERLVDKMIELDQHEGKRIGLSLLKERYKQESASRLSETDAIDFIEWMNSHIDTPAGGWGT